MNEGAIDRERTERRGGPRVGVFSSRRLHILPIGGIFRNVYRFTSCKYTSCRVTKLCREGGTLVTEEVP